MFDASATTSGESGQDSGASVANEAAQALDQGRRPEGPIKSDDEMIAALVEDEQGKHVKREVAARERAGVKTPDEKSKMKAAADFVSGKDEAKPHIIGEEESEEGETAIDDNDPLAIFNKEMERLSGPPKPESEEDQFLKSLDPKSRASLEIRTLRSRTRQAEEQNKALQEQIASFSEDSTQKFRAAITENMQLRESLASVQAKVDMFMQQQKNTANQTVEERVNNEWSDRISKLIEDRVQPLKQQNETLKKMFEERDQKAKQAEMRRRTRGEADTLLKKMIFADVDEQTIGDYTDDYRSMLYGVRLDRNIPLDKAAERARRAMLAWSIGFLKGKKNASAAQRQRAAGAPPRVPASNTNPAGEGKPSRDLLRANGFKDVMQWRLEGKPALRPLPREK